MSAAFFAGFGILRAAAIIPGIGFIVWFVASLYGLGALILAAWRAGHTPAASGTARPRPHRRPHPARRLRSSRV